MTQRSDCCVFGGRGLAVPDEFIGVGSFAQGLTAGAVKG